MKEPLDLETNQIFLFSYLKFSEGFDIRVTRDSQGFGIEVALFFTLYTIRNGNIA